MVMPLIMSMQATNWAYDGAGGMFNGHQEIMGSANKATGYESQSDIASMAAQEKAIRFSGIQAYAHYKAGIALQGAAEEMRRQNREQKERMQANGALFF
jgi:hypothetical protein